MFAGFATTLAKFKYPTHVPARETGPHHWKALRLPTAQSRRAVACGLSAAHAPLSGDRLQAFVPYNGQ